MDKARIGRRRVAHPRRRLRRRAAAAALCSLLASGCIPGAGSAEEPLAKNPSESPTTGARGVAMPSGFANPRAWSLDVRTREYAVAPGANRILDVYGLGDTGDESASPSDDGTPQAEPTVVFARSADDGKVLWRSRPLVVLSDQTTPLIEVLSTAQGEIGVVARVGTVPGTGMVRDKRVMTIDAYRATSTGEDVAPIQHFERDMPTDSGMLPMAVGAGGVLLHPAAETSGPTQVWDPVTGALHDVGPLPDTTRAVLPTAAGPLVIDEELDDGRGHDCITSDFTCKRGFGILGKWTAASDAAPKNPLGVPLLATPNVVLAGWWDQKFADDDLMHYTVHDLTTGRVVASTDCRAMFDRKKPPQDGAAGAAVSPDGRYIAAGSAVFDLSAGIGFCLGGDDRTKAVDLAAVTDAGIAYGRVDEENGASLTVRIATRAVEVLPSETSVPDIVTRSGAGVYRIAAPDSEGGGTATIVVFPPG
ncbi:MAG: hypothetical protein HOV66_29420 [Streptomycetaceae bacterium]|jgi:hypothetical protein|nr:hypothetical protein [Streptomycetaceae bacterium]